MVRAMHMPVVSAVPFVDGSVAASGDVSRAFGE
jgi:hypothetical protein